MDPATAFDTANKYNLTVTQARILCHMAAKETTVQLDLSKDLQLDLSIVSRNIHTLTSANLTAIHPSTETHRAKRYTLTEKGKLIIAAMQGHETGHTHR